jgi:site-specific DNA recombinase
VTRAPGPIEAQQPRSSLEAGADPKIVTMWISEVQGERLAAEQAIAETGEHRKFTRTELRELILQTDIREALQTAEREGKRKLYESVGLSLTFDP